MEYDNILAVKTRCGLDEVVYRGHIAVADAEGNIVKSYGDPNYVTFMRSASKPWQALILVTSGAYKKFNLDLRHLAVASGSHNGQKIHTDAVADMLEKAGISQDCFSCGTHPPLSEAAMRELEGKEFRQINHNCSGKHAAMLIACNMYGWDVANYTAIDHPVQKMLLSIVARLCDMTESLIKIGIDGCSVPVFGIPISKMSQGFARLSMPTKAPTELQEACELVNASIKAHPLLLAGEDRIDTYLMQDNPDMICKSGAEGVHCMAKDGLGLTFKIEAGEINPVLKMGVANCVSAIGGVAGQKLSPYLHQDIANHKGEVVGELKWTQSV